MANEADKPKDDEENERVEQSSHTGELANTYSSYLVAMSGLIDDVYAKLLDSAIYDVGIHGNHGAGKTRLAKEVAEKFKKNREFNQVIFIRVGSMGDEKKIQDQIFKALGMTRVTEEDSNERSARQISQRLRSGGRILVILEDIWDIIDMKKVGLPDLGGHRDYYNQDGDRHHSYDKCCKLMLTTSSLSVIYDMGCNNLVPQYILHDKDAWCLFLMRAGIGNVDSINQSAHPLSWQLVLECKGLPVQLVVAGGCLRRKSSDGWEAAVKENIFQNSDRGNLSRLLVKWSYKELSSKVPKCMFLISCLFLKDEMLIEDLSDYAISLGLCVRDEVNAAINELVDSGLFNHYDDDDSKDRVTINLCVHNVAHFIVEEEYPAHWASVKQCCMSRGSQLSESEISRWKREEFDGLVDKIFHVREESSSSTSLPSSSMVPFSPQVYNLQPSLLSSTEVYRNNIEALSKEDKKRNAKAAKLSQEIKEREEKARQLRQKLEVDETEAERFSTEMPAFVSKFHNLNPLTIEALRKEEAEQKARVLKLRRQLLDLETNVLNQKYWWKPKFTRKR